MVHKGFIKYIYWVKEAFYDIARRFFVLGKMLTKKEGISNCKMELDNNKHP